ncbi:MAG TPA: hypothetical protein VGI71_07235 [Scandinavium sp.]|jgi:hypothetical protein
MSPETRARVEAFRTALELAVGECANGELPVYWCDWLKYFPRGCCELASQTLVRYLMEHDNNLFPSVIGMQWDDGPKRHGHVIVALDGGYIDLTLDQFDGYDDRIVVEPIESGGKIAAFIRKVRSQGGTLTTRKLTFAGLPAESEKLYTWLKKRADSLLAAAKKNVKPCSLPSPLSMEIPEEYRDWSPVGSSTKASHAPEKKRRSKMTHEGTITECYKPRHVRLRETGTHWISECGLRFRKSTGAAVGSGVWSANRLDLKSIREIQSED